MPPNRNSPTHCAMPDYAVFGGCLRADLTIPEFCETTGRTPDWTVRTVDRSELPAGAESLGAEELSQNLFVRSFVWPSGWRVEYDDTGSFDISRDGSEIRWCPRPEATREAACIDLTGRVLAMAMHAAGMLCLHGSSVALGDAGVAFVAPKFHGKSTLALALAKAGGCLMNDDMVPIDIGAPAMMRPGGHRVRLWSDSVERLGGDALRPTRAADQKFDLEYLSDTSVMRDPVPLAAIYVLAPARESTTAAERTRLAPVPSAITLVRHAKIGALLRQRESTVLLDRAIALAEVVPVYTLHVVRDFERLPDVVGQIMAWHACELPLAPAGAAR